MNSSGNRFRLGFLEVNVVITGKQAGTATFSDYETITQLMDLLKRDKEKGKNQMVLFWRSMTWSLEMERKLLRGTLHDLELLLS